MMNKMIVSNLAHRPVRSFISIAAIALEVTLILLIAFALTSAFVLRHSKLARRDHLTAIAVAAQLRAWTSKVPPSIRAPD